MATERGIKSALPLAHCPPLPSALIQPSGPGSWESVPVVLSRTSTATALPNCDATYTCLPSLLMAIEVGPESALPPAQGPRPVWLKQPCGPGSWVNAPHWAPAVPAQASSRLVMASMFFIVELILVTSHAPRRPFSGECQAASTEERLPFG